MARWWHDAAEDKETTLQQQPQDSARDADAFGSDARREITQVQL
jgi:hypothetical protein